MEKQQHTGFRDILRILTRRWKLIAAFGILGTLLGLYQYRTTPLAFSSASKVLVEKPSGFAITASVPGFGGMATATSTKQQLQFLQSEPYKHLATSFSSLARDIPLDLTDLTVANDISSVIQNSVLNARQVAPVRLMLYDRPAAKLLAFEQEKVIDDAPALVTELALLARMAGKPELGVFSGSESRDVSKRDEATWAKLRALADTKLMERLWSLGVNQTAAVDSILTARSALGTPSQIQSTAGATENLLTGARLAIACKVVGTLDRLDRAQRPRKKPLFSLGGGKVRPRTGKLISDLTNPDEVTQAAQEIMASPHVSKLLSKSDVVGMNARWPALSPGEKLKVLYRAGDEQWAQDRKSPPEKRDSVWSVAGREGQEGSDIIQISQVAPSSYEARRGANAYAIMMVWKDRMTKVADLERSVRFLNDAVYNPVDGAEKKLKDVQNAFTEFRKKQNMVDIPSQMALEVGKYVDYERGVIAAETELKATNTALQEIERQLAGDDLVLRTVNPTNIARSISEDISQNPVYASTQTALFAAQAKLAEMEANYQTGYPPLEAQKATVAELTRQLKEIARDSASKGGATQEQPNLVYQGIASKYAELMANKAAVEGRQAAVKTLKDRMESTYRGLPDTQSRYFDYARDQAQAEEEYKGLYARLLDAQVNKEMRQGNARVVELAVEPGKKSQPRLRFIIVAALLGLFFGSLAALALSSSDTHLRTPEDVQRELELPVLAHLPSLPGGNTLVVESQPTAPATEAIRSLRSTLRFLGGDKPIKTIAATSTRAGEGKSTLVANLAASLAQSGLTVTAVDADLRRPRLASFFGLPLAPGLSDALGGREAKQVRASTRIPGLWVVPAGQAPSNPGELLDNGRVAKAILDLSEGSDFVLVDTPPVGVVADATLVGAAVDATLLVIESGTVEPDEARKAVARLTDHARANVVGVVLIGGDAPVPDDYIRYVSVPDEAGNGGTGRRNRKARSN